MSAQKPMRMALYHNLPSGGGKRALYEWVRRLATKGVQFDVFTLDTADHDYCDIRPFARSHRVYAFKHKPLFRRPLGRLNKLQYWRDLLEVERQGQTVARDIDAGGYDLVLVNPCVLSAVPGVLQFLKTPSLFYLHEPFGKKFIRPFYRAYLNYGPVHAIADGLDPFIAGYDRQLERMRAAGLRAATRVLANSQFTRQVIAREYGVQARVCYLGVSTTDFAPDDTVHRQSHVLSVGEGAPRKGHDFLIESLAHLPQASRPVLRLAANYEFRYETAHLNHLADKHKVSLEIRMKLNTAQLADEYRSACMLVYSPVLEPFGLAPLEAMACGTAVVAVKEGGVCETVLHNETGLLVERNPEQFAQAMQSLLDAPARCQQLGRTGRDIVVKQWNWDESVRHLEIELADFNP